MWRHMGVYEVVRVVAWIHLFKHIYWVLQRVPYVFHGVYIWQCRSLVTVSGICLVSPEHDGGYIMLLKQKITAAKQQKVCKWSAPVKTDCTCSLCKLPTLHHYRAITRFHNILFTDSIDSLIWSPSYTDSTVCLKAMET